MSLKVYGVGYGQDTLEQLAERIRPYGVTHLVDVRSVPYSSYQKAFNREALARSVQALGLKYVYLGDRLGAMPEDPEVRTDGQPDREKILASKAFNEALDKIVEAAEKPGKAICVMCGCLRAVTCHRSGLIGEGLWARGIDLMHIEAGGEVVPHSELRELLEEQQPSLF